MLKVTSACCFLYIQNELTTCINRVLEEAKQKWEDGEEPLREDGCFVIFVAYDLIQVQFHQHNIVTL